MELPKNMTPDQRPLTSGHNTEMGHNADRKPCLILCDPQLKPFKIFLEAASIIMQKVSSVVQKAFPNTSGRDSHFF